MRFVLASAVVALAALSQVPAAVAEPARGGAIIGGSVDLADPAVVGVRLCKGTACVTCSGTLVAERTVVTAAHCVDDYLADLGGIEVYFGTNMNGGDGSFVAVDAALMHRYFDPGALVFDIAALHLAAAAPDGVVPVVVNQDPLADSDQGRSVRMVGFGVTDFGAGDEGTKRQVEAVMSSFSARQLFTGSADANTCKGDSGGPTFLDFPDGERQIGVTSRSVNCGPNSVKTRVDPFLADVVWRLADRYDGPCAQDGTCVTDCPRSPDPDCDPCAWDGTCQDGCPQADWDCPLGLALGDACDDDQACEARRCQVGLDDPRVRYCSAACTGDGTESCLAGMECRDPDGGGLRCVWPGPTPGALGSTCALGTSCRSGICEDSICVEPCDQVAGGACPEPLVCRPSSEIDGEVCGRAPAGDDGCGCRSTGGSSSVLLLAVAALVAGLRRRAGRAGGGAGRGRPGRARRDRR